MAQGVLLSAPPPCPLSQGWGPAWRGSICTRAILSQCGHHRVQCYNWTTANGIDMWKDFQPGRTVMELESAFWNLLLFYTQLRGSSMFNTSFLPPSVYP